MSLPGAWLLLAPAGLLGLLALAVPVAIHLISRGQGRRVLIGNIELVRAARETRVTSLRLTEWLLLLLRLLIVLVATLLLARLALQGQGSIEGDVRYVTPGWLRAATDSERDDILSQTPAARVLAAGYPEARGYEPTAANSGYDVWPLLAERLSTLRHAGTVDVYAEARAAAFGRPRPRLPNAITWHLAAAPATPLAFDSRGLVVYDSDRAGDAARVEHALGALQRHRLPRLEWTSCSLDDAICQRVAPDWVAWLAAAEPDIDDARLYRPEGPASRLDMTDPRFPESLLGTVLSDEQRHLAWQQTPISVAALDTGAESAASVPLPYRSLHSWLGLLLLLLWAAERFLCERRRSDDD